MCASLLCFACKFVCSLVRLFLRWFVCLSVCLFVCLLGDLWLVCWFGCNCFVCLFDRSFSQLVGRSYVCPFVRSFVCLLASLFVGCVIVRPFGEHVGGEGGGGGGRCSVAGVSCFFLGLKVTGWKEIVTRTGMTVLGDSPAQPTPRSPTMWCVPQKTPFALRFCLLTNVLKGQLFCFAKKI